MARSKRKGLIPPDIYKEILKHKYVIGCDEVGTGALAGPAVVAAVVYPSDFVGWDSLRDSKKYFSARHRELDGWRVYDSALAFSLVYIPVDDIDTNGLRPSLTKAVIDVVTDCREVFPDSLAVIDGNMKLPIPHISLPKADDLVPAVSAASVLAKVERDWWMWEVAEKAHPGYDFALNKGYGSPRHYRALVERGISPMHRKSFRLKSKIMDGGDPFLREVRELTEAEMEMRTLRRENNKLKDRIAFLEQERPDASSSK